jgi:hypothetical protein
VRLGVLTAEEAELIGATYRCPRVRSTAWWWRSR